MRFGIDVAQHQLSWNELLSRTRWAEEAGFDGAWVFDHFKALYGDPEGPCLEGWSLLAALGAATERIRLGSMVTGVTYRHPSVLAAQAVTVDHISNGRLEFGIGAAWFDGEHRELGIEYPSNGKRAARLEDAIEIYKRLATGDNVSYEGRYFSLTNATYRPRPVQQPHPPIWVGASGRRLMLPIVGRHADVWHSFGSIDDLERKWQVIERAAEEAGRDPSDIERATDLSISEPWDEIERDLEKKLDAGFTYIRVSWPGQGQDHVEEFVERIMRPALG